eukprot:3812651-Ditylum_brightwellii.AAC.1
MHHELACKVCEKEFGDVEGDNIVVPSMKEHVYTYLGNMNNDCKVGLCQEHYTELSMKMSNSSKTRCCITHNS